MIWLYIILALFVLLGLFLLLRLRIRVVLDGDEKIAFVGLGRSGPEFDFVQKTARFRIAGFTFKTYSFDQMKERVSGREKDAGDTEESQDAAVGEEKKEKQPKRQSRSLVNRISSLGKETLKELWELLKTVPKAAIGFIIGVLRDCKLEELNGRIEAGFDSPDQTGRAYGYYCAVAGALPGTVGRFSFIPDWTGASFSGSVRLSIGLPLYRLLFRTVRLLWQLPMRKIWKLRKAQSEGESDE